MNGSGWREQAPCVEGGGETKYVPRGRRCRTRRIPRRRSRRDGSQHTCLRTSAHSVHSVPTVPSVGTAEHTLHAVGERTCALCGTVVAVLYLSCTTVPHGGSPHTYRPIGTDRVRVCVARMSSVVVHVPIGLAPLVGVRSAGAWAKRSSALPCPGSAPLAAQTCHGPRPHARGDRRA